MILASVLLFAACAPEAPTTSFDNIKLDKTYVVISEEGGSAQLTINATEDWAFDTLYTKDVWPNVITRKTDKETNKEYVASVEASWLSVDKLANSAGETVLTFKAEAVAGGRELELCIKAGANSQFVRVRQGSLEASSATCKEIIAGPDGKTYRTKGLVTLIENTTYGNWWLDDGTGSVLVYGTLDKDGKTKNFASLGIEVGDEVEVEGPKLTYGTKVELVDVTVLSIKKSLVKVISAEPTLEPEASEFEVKVAFKGDGLYPTVAAESKSWISIVGVRSYAGTPTKIEQSPADTAIVTCAVAENATYELRQGVINFLSASGKNSSDMDYKIKQKGLTPPTLPTIAEVRASTKGDQVVTVGTVMALHKQGYIISDETATIYVYTKDAPTVAVGNKIQVSGEFDNYFGTLQIKNTTVVENDNSTATPAYPTPVDLTDQATYDAYGKFSADNPTEFAFVKIKGVLSGDYSSIVTVGTSTKTAQFDYSLGNYSALNGKTVVVTAYVKGFHSKGYYQLIETSVEEASAGDVPANPWETAAVAVNGPDATDDALMKEIRAYADANNLYIRVTAAADLGGANYLDVLFCDGNGETAVWWGWTTTGTNTYWAEHQGSVDEQGNLTEMEFGDAKVAVSTEKTADSTVWYLTYPRESVATYVNAGKIYVSALLWNGWGPYYAAPARGNSMLEVTLP